MGRLVGKVAVVTGAAHGIGASIAERFAEEGAVLVLLDIDGEGLMRGFPLEIAQRLRVLTARQLIVAGGIRSQEEIDKLAAIHVDAVAGMAVYTNLLPA